MSLFLLSTGVASATVMVGRVETFNSGTAGFGFARGSTVTQELGGVDGPGDGFLSIANSTVARFSARVASSNTPFTGNYTEAGVEGVRFSIISLDAAGAIDLRIGFGTRQTNFWVSNIGFEPVFGEDWQEVEISFQDVSDWSAVRGSGTEEEFAEALENVNGFQFRHVDFLNQAPSSGIGVIGIDNVVFLGVPEPAAGCLLSLSSLVLLKRRRVS